MHLKPVFHPPVMVIVGLIVQCYALTSPASDAASKGKKGVKDWRATVLSLLENAMGFPAALPFTSPVSKKDAPGYHAVIKRPMDLGTLRDRVAKGMYSEPLAVLSDIKLVRSQGVAELSASPPCLTSEPHSEPCTPTASLQAHLKAKGS